MWSGEPGEPVIPQRAQRLVELNLHLARYAHRSWYEAALLEANIAGVMLDDRGRVSGRFEPCISRWLSEELGATDFDWDMREPQKRVWLLDRANVERLALELALAMHREWVVQIIDSARLRALAGAVGADALRFVIEDVPAGCFHYQSPLVSFDGTSAGDVAAELRGHGARTLMALLEPAWHAVRSRAALFFDRALELSADPPLEPALAHRALDLILQRLIPRRFPKWAWCF